MFLSVRRTALTARTTTTRMLWRTHDRRNAARRTATAGQPDTVPEGRVSPTGRGAETHPARPDDRWAAGFAGRAGTRRLQPTAARLARQSRADKDPAARFTEGRFVGHHRQ